MVKTAQIRRCQELDKLGEHVVAMRRAVERIVRAPFDKDLVNPSCRVLSCYK